MAPKGRGRFSELNTSSWKLPLGLSTAPNDPFWQFPQVSAQQGRCASTGTRLPGCSWLCQREQGGGGDASETRARTRGEERTLPGYYWSTWARLSRKGLDYILLIFMRLMLLNRYGTFSRGNAGPGHSQPRRYHGKVPSEEALPQCSRNYQTFIPSENLRPPIEHENTWQPHLRQHVARSQPHCRRVHRFFAVVGHTYDLQRPKPTALTYMKAGCVRCCCFICFHLRFLPCCSKNPNRPR